MSSVWNLDRLLNGKTEDIILKEVEEKVLNLELWRDRLDILTPEEFLSYLKEDEELSLLYSNLCNYYSLKSFEDTSNDAVLSKLSSLENLETDISNRTMFFELWFQSISEEKSKEFIESPLLKDYKHFLEKIRVYIPYTKDEKTEQLLNYETSVGGNYNNLYDIITNRYTFKWEGKEVNESEVQKYRTDEDPKKRVKAYKLILKKHGDDSIVLNEIYRNVVNHWNNKYMKIRGYKYPITPRNMSNDISDEVVETVLKVIQKNAPMFADYFKFKWEFNGKKYKHSRYHTLAPLNINTEEKKYDYETVKQFVIDTYTKFDPEFGQKCKKVFDDDAVHSHPQDKKSGGAFCAHIPYQTPYVLLNHTDRLEDVSTIAHDSGHAIHELFSNKQVSVSQHPSLPIAETASTFGEILLYGRLIDECKNDKEKIKRLSEIVGDCYSTIVRQAYFVIFEKYAHENIINGATKEDLDKEYIRLLKEQFGDMEIPEEFKHEWNMITHIHASPFYCYSYSFGYLLVMVLYSLYKKDPNSFIPKYKEFLSSGGSKSIVELLSIFDLDPTKEEFCKSGFDVIKDYFSELLELTN